MGRLFKQIQAVILVGRHGCRLGGEGPVGRDISRLFSDSKFNRLRSSWRETGFTFVEVLIAAALFGIGILAIYMVNAQCMQMAVAARNMSQASHILQERAGTLRAAMFSGTSTLTSGSLQTLLNRPALSGTAGSLISGTETITVSGSGTIPMTVTRAIGVTATPTVTGSKVNSPAIVELRLDWSEHSGGHPRLLYRTLVTVIAKTN